jgi:UDP-N-acetylmuramoyl-tripeptide--D-alanyl-D-alanine ligase
MDGERAAIACDGRWRGNPPPVLGRFAHDTRRMRGGETFVALRGERADGHEHLAAAQEQGALAALVERPRAEVSLPQLVAQDSLRALQMIATAARQEFSGPVVGITGSFGKTTVREMLGCALGGGWYRTKENFNNHIGLPLSLLELVAEGAEGAILEAGINRAGEMELLAGILQPDHAVITGVGPAHLEQLGDLDGVAREKARLAAAVPAGGIVVLPLELLRYAPFREAAAGKRVIAIDGAGEGIPGLSGDVAIYHYKWTDENGPEGGVLTMETPSFRGRLSFAAGSRGMVRNLALVVAMAGALGREADAIRHGLAAWRPFRQRGEILQCGKGHFYIDCYNANPVSMIDSMERFRRRFADRPHFYVLGGMAELGPAEADWHRDTARRLPLVPGNPVALVGEAAAWYQEGLAERTDGPWEPRIVEDAAELAMELEDFEGAVFLKGSRRHALERLLPEEATPC